MIPIDGQPILTAARMRAAEEAHAPTPEAMHALMERAGAAVADAVRRLAAGAEVLVLCGPGNNGGDGYVAARVLREAGHPVRVAASGDPATDLARAARARWTGPVQLLADAPPAPVLVDALFGTGLSRALAQDVSNATRSLVGRARLSIAVDLPSGLATDTGEDLGATGCDLTLALGALKPAHVLRPAAGFCGTVRLLDTGVGPESTIRAMTRMGGVRPRLDDQKFSRGMVAVIAGSMPGAAALAAGAAARIAGYTLLLGSSTDRLPHAIVRRRWSPDLLADERIGAVVIGPGLGRDDAARSRLDAALASSRPLVIDGDALHLLDPARLRSRQAPTVLTPHGGEFAHMFGERQGSKIDRARAAADRCGATIVFKGADTVVAASDDRTRVAHAHAPWLATAGTGDVLAGIVGALLAHTGDPFIAANDGVMIHAAAAHAAGEGLIADDLPSAIPAGLRAGW